MNIKTLNKKLGKRFGGAVIAREDEYSVILSGKVDSWEDMLSACYMAADKKSGKHVVNDIVVSGIVPSKTRLPEERDKTLDGESFDVAIIGGGISGASILRELTKWNVKAVLLEKESDLALHASGRNDGEVHPGVDLSKGSVKQSYVVKANRMYDKVCKELDVPFRRVGQYAGFTQGWLLPIVWLFTLQRRFACGVDDTRIVLKKTIKEREPKLNREFAFAIYNPMAGCVSPYNLTIAYGENAVENGAKVCLDTAVLSMEVENGEIKSVETTKGKIFPKVVINAAGCFAEDVAKMAGDRFYSIHPRRGTISILDKKSGGIIKSIASIKKLGGHSHSKGGGMLHTVHDNVLVGPDAVETSEKEYFGTTRESIQTVFDKQKNTAPSLSERDIITYFTGVRAATFEEDYIICRGKRTKNLIHVAGIQSPGLTTAPAVALDVEKMTVELLKELKCEVRKNENFNPIRKGVPNLAEMSEEEREEYIKKNPDYGIIVCRCEEVSKGEILDAIKRPIKVATIDGVKKRVRPGMGRCQGGFCAPIVAKIIAENENIPLEKVRKSGEDSEIAFGGTKGGASYDV